MTLSDHELFWLICLIGIMFPLVTVWVVLQCVSPPVGLCVFAHITRGQSSQNSPAALIKSDASLWPQHQNHQNIEPYGQKIITTCTCTTGIQVQELKISDLAASSQTLAVTSHYFWLVLISKKLMSTQKSKGMRFGFKQLLVGTSVMCRPK